MAEREFDLVIFGASGFTGEYVLKEAAKILEIQSGALAEYSKNAKWAIAGRSQEKLDAAKAKAGESVAAVATILADVGDAESLRAMAKRTKVILNCVGPYRFFGAPVVAACVEEGTDCVDLCGEPEFLEKTALEFHEAAKQKGVLIVGSCGFDSIPADCGVQAARRAFSPGLCVSAETFLHLQTGPKGGAVHYATFQAAVEGVGNAHILQEIRKKAQGQKPKLTRVGPKLKIQQGPFETSKYDGKACYAFMGADASVIKRSFEFFTEKDSKFISPQHACYFCLPKEHSRKMNIYGGMFMTLAKFSLGRSLLLQYPGFFTNQFFTREGPSEEQMAETSFWIDIFASGTSAAVSDPSADLSGQIDKHVKVTVKGPEPGYIATSSFLCCAALAVLREKGSRIASGGVLTPGFAFEDSRLFELLQQRDVSIEVSEVQQ
uniref:Saccharopine dehydrogenase NADP binding domain-containing protein n=1 Tax=Chromera velia CCMP2878 TaxID=1169474 RepID=A0A0G4HUL4_9ALVE|mmetsp:Transcript_53852/g.105316  ORF Transcript_53852/g.105316 Transcript_53852/m.105316 type:complete len:434 (-) Transcript_53852:926-2227(-)|eukprot:Cvel_8642.t1-p1 / transcript=Cvel_8642.t1 / gene=Cvel_8642 / organism=Chromera_velia_CCMP2878 / gene_product=Saccharopine dehydrogenase-like oxidoreductase, putative / transcript_product=Saccharopine dehydrogenase-like oxidoreductase, putative / location=Cvel_scaffold481:63279-70949(+) / protein_length=433 / sequence_SO=supercontig / SO=protein_coding / is_pseudo=false